MPGASGFWLTRTYVPSASTNANGSPLLSVPADGVMMRAGMRERPVRATISAMQSTASRPRGLCGLVSSAWMSLTASVSL
jgi:hypothetical protein